MVDESQIISDEKEWRTFEDSKNGGVDPSRISGHIDSNDLCTTICASSSSAMNGSTSTGKGSKSTSMNVTNLDITQKRLRSRASIKTHKIDCVVTDTYRSALDESAPSTHTIIVRAKELLNRLQDTSTTTIRTTPALASAAIMIVSRMKQCPIAFDRFSVDSKQIRSAMKPIMKMIAREAKDTSGDMEQLKPLTKEASELQLALVQKQKESAGHAAIRKMQYSISSHDVDKRCNECGLRVPQDSLVVLFIFKRLCSSNLQIFFDDTPKPLTTLAGAILLHWYVEYPNTTVEEKQAIMKRVSMVCGITPGTIKQRYKEIWYPMRMEVFPFARKETEVNVEELKQWTAREVAILNTKREWMLSKLKATTATASSSSSSSTIPPIATDTHPYVKSTIHLRLSIRKDAVTASTDFLSMNPFVVVDPLNIDHRCPPQLVG